jgi:hypothetical protein
LRAGKQKVKGEWEMVAFFSLLHILDDGSVSPATYYGHREGPIRIKLKGKA